LLEAERHSLEFTSGQLIIAICGLLFLWLVGFLMGVMAGRLELGSSLAKKEGSPAATHASAKNETKPATKPTASDKARVAEIPAPQVPKAAPAQAKPAETKPVEAQPAADKKPESAVKYVTERPDRPTAAATATRAEAAAPAPAPVPAQTPAAPPAVVAKAEPAPAAEAPKTETAEKPKEETAKTTEKSKEEAPKEDTAKKGGKAFGVQVFSVRVQNRSNADEYVTLLKQNSGVSADVVKSKDGKNYNVVIGRYATRKEAEAKRDELKKKPGFADCMVREIS
jgi:cell division septation protein DedD